MARFNFRIGTKLGLTVGNQSIATLRTLVITNFSSKSNAQTTEGAMMQAHNRGASATGSASAQALASARSLSNESGNLKTEVEKFLRTVRAA